MGLFDAFRTIPAPTLYGENRNAVSADILIAGLITAFMMIFVSFLIGIVPATQSPIRTISAFLRIFFALFVGCSILVCEFGDGWRVDEETANVYLKQPFIGTTNLSNVNIEVRAAVGIHVGLHGVNITLKGSPVNQNVGGVNEEINYNSHFTFGILQGRLGFGTQAGLISQEFREAQYRGAPLPILWVAEYLTLDGEDIRWGRNLRQAGYYTSLLLWTSFAWWILTIVLLTQALPYGAIFLSLTGLYLIAACCVYAGLHDAHGPPLKIPLADHVALEPHYGWSFILTLFNGLLCLVIAVLIYVMYLRFPELLYEFFHLDVLEEEDLLEVQRGIDINSGYLCTWDEEKQQTVAAVDSLKGGSAHIASLDKDVARDVERARTPSQRNHETFAELRKSRRSVRRPQERASHGLTFSGVQSDPMSQRKGDTLEMRKMNGSPVPSEHSVAERSPGNIILRSALKASRKIKKPDWAASTHLSPTDDMLMSVKANELVVSGDDAANTSSNQLLPEPKQSPVARKSSEIPLVYDEQAENV